MRAQLESFIAPISTRFRDLMSDRRYGNLARGGLAMVTVAMMAIPCWAQQASKELAKKSLEDLMNIEVTSVSKTPQPLARSAAAIYVITQEDIQRSGATSVPELLRMVPGLDVAQIDSSTWAISSRGFNSQYANKMLVLVDGRIVYSPSFSGVVWDEQDLVLEDIERIEVIRGPGATLWGSNAVNGVINIITKKAQDTPGGLLSVKTGNEEGIETTTQYGGRAADKGYYRIFAKYFDREGFATAAGENADDGWHMTHAGFRSDWELSKHDSLTIQGGFFSGRQNHTIPFVVSLQPIVSGQFNLPFEAAGGNLLGRWNHAFSPRAAATLQAYFDDSDRDQSIVSEHRHSTDIDFQDRVALGNRHDLVWGIGYRYERDRLPGSLPLSFSPVNSSLSRYSSFAQDDISLVPNRLRIMLGARLEHDPYTGFNVQPDFRVFWSPTKNQSIWGAISRPERTPSRADIGVRFILSAFPGPGGIPTAVTSYGNPGLDNEHLASFQIGYRSQLRDSLSLDITAYHSRYSQLSTAERQAPFIETDPMPPHLSIPVVSANAMGGTTDGVELESSWQVKNWWKVAGGYTWLHMDIRDQVTGNPSNVAYVQSTNPQHQLNFRSYVNLPKNLQWDTTMYYVGLLPGNLVSTYAVAAYTRLDTRVAWRFKERGEVSLTGQNLLQPRHLEFASSQVSSSSLVRRSFYVGFAWHF